MNLKWLGFKSIAIQYLRMNCSFFIGLVENTSIGSIIFIPLHRKQKYLFGDYDQKSISETMQLNTHN